MSKDSEISKLMIRYERALVGHVMCDTSRWVWTKYEVTGEGRDRAFGEDWECPRCGFMMYKYAIDGDSFLVDFGVMVVENEVEI